MPTSPLPPPPTQALANQDTLGNVNSLPFTHPHTHTSNPNPTATPSDASPQAVVNQDTLGDVKALQAENARLQRELAKREVGVREGG